MLALPAFSLLLPQETVAQTMTASVRIQPTIQSTSSYPWHLSVTETGNLLSFSNYGENTVHLGAPSSSILSTVPSNTYGYKSVTSMAAPHVTGAAAGAIEIKNKIMDSVKVTGSLRRTISGGQLDIGAMAHLCSGDTSSGPDPDPPVPEPECSANGNDCETGSDCCSGRCHPQWKTCT